MIVCTPVEIYTATAPRHGRLVHCDTVALFTLYCDMVALLKWQCAFLAHSQNPHQPVTCADTCLQISLMVTDIQNISRFGWNLQNFRFCITAAVAVRIFGVPLDLLLQDLVTLPQTTTNILGYVILRLGLNSCDAGTICLQFGQKGSITNNVM